MVKTKRKERIGERSEDGIREIEEPECEPKHRSLFIGYLKERIAHNKNCILAIVGETGSGKSYAALRLAEELDPNFCVEHVAFKAEEFLALLQKDLPKGTAIVFDETGVAWQSRRFMQFINITLSAALQTVRFKNHYIIMTVPDLSFVDAQGRKLMHMYLVTEKVLYGKKKSRLRPYMISISHRLRDAGKVYSISPRIKTGNIYTKIKKIDLKLPSAKIKHLYEAKKLSYVNDLYKKAANQIQEDYEKATAKAEGNNGYRKSLNKNYYNNTKDAFTERQRTVMELLRVGMSTSEIADRLKISDSRVSAVRRALSTKGITIGTL